MFQSVMFLKTVYNTKPKVTDITLITRFGTLFSRLNVCLETTQGRCAVFLLLLLVPEMGNDMQ